MWMGEERSAENIGAVLLLDASGIETVVVHMQTTTGQALDKAEFTISLRISLRKRGGGGGREKRSINQAS